MENQQPSDTFFSVQKSVVTLKTIPGTFGTKEGGDS